eukprot:COSAG02_NODE_5188_length_4558_cov_2.133887_1_plen_234_part_00
MCSAELSSGVSPTSRLAPAARAARAVVRSFASHAARSSRLVVPAPANHNPDQRQRKTARNTPRYRYTKHKYAATRPRPAAQRQSKRRHKDPHTDTPSTNTQPRDLDQQRNANRKEDTKQPVIRTARLRLGRFPLRRLPQPALRGHPPPPHTPLRRAACLHTPCHYHSQQSTVWRGSKRGDLFPPSPCMPPAGSGFSPQAGAQNHSKFSSDLRENAATRGGHEQVSGVDGISHT